jgi:hypothetical protein
MSWQPNKQAPIEEDTQKAVIKALTDMVGDLKDQRVAYIPQNIVKDCEGKFGTVGGKAGNTFSNGMAELLKKSEHVLMCYVREQEEGFGKKKDSKVLIASMAVAGLSTGAAVKLGLLAKLAGGSLSPSFVKIGKEEWAIYKSETT